MDIGIGKVHVFINQKEIECKIKELPCHSKLFDVNRRFKIEYKLPEQLNSYEIECKFKPDKHAKLIANVETGENLALISFYLDNIKLSIGTKGDIPGVKYTYFDYGMKLNVESKLSEIVFFVAWTKITDIEKEDIYTWFAADPSYEKLKMV